MARVRFWMESGLAAVSGALLVLTLIRRDWIEVAFGVDPDQRSGSLESTIVVGLVVVTVVLAGLAGVEYRRLRAAASR